VLRGEAALGGSVARFRRQARNLAPVLRGEAALGGSVARFRRQARNLAPLSSGAPDCAVRIGADTGGTFTDLVGDDGTVVKVASTPDDPRVALRRGLEHTTTPEAICYGTTVATNALLERRGARVALLATDGFADEIEIARQTRPSLYDTFADRPAPLVERDDRFGVRERLAAGGTVIAPLDPATLPAIPDGIGAVAVCLLHADLDARHERVVADHYRALGHDVSCSHEISPEMREYERMVTTVANAYLRPVCRTGLDGLDDIARAVLVMTSAGGLVPVAEAAARPAALLLSGPAGGVRAAAAIAASCGLTDVVAFDMGGTSTDVCLVRAGVPEPAPQRTIGGLPIRLPALDVHTIGAGGGSIARLDAGGALAVGPRSAGAVPGPACYGQGGREPTVTDADLALGRIPVDHGFGALGRLDVAAARAALGRAGVEAAGIVAVVDENMRQAVRAVTVARGVDPRTTALVAFGGAGPLHACAVAEGLGIPTVVVPPRAGVFSAVGLLASPRRRELVRTWTGGDLGQALAELAHEAVDAVGAGARVETAVDCRYVGQSHEITVDAPSAFPAEHARRNGYARTDAPVEVVALRARATIDAPCTVDDLPVIDRRAVVGPAVVAEADCTVWVPDGWRGDPGPFGTLILRPAAP
jgi:N-methylhydantoinase A/oxoprolinase/acetone carboxylase beta subunit